MNVASEFNHDEFINKDDLRKLFAEMLSKMYRAEVPKYGDMIDLTEESNKQHLAKVASDNNVSPEDLLARVTQERHGAIRLGTAQELSTMCRLFAIMGMEPTGYYDLSVAGIPVHSTGFRPVTNEGLQKAPFRMFTSLLQLEKIKNKELREQARTILSERKIFSDRLVEMIDAAEKRGGLLKSEAQEFLHEALKTFKWHDEAAVDYDTYIKMKEVHPILADIVCFKGPHINHLTPRALNIDDAHAQLEAAPDIQAKANIEGPPPRAVDILLRQTSMKALTESITFTCGHKGEHTARFGEIEQRGIALTPKGREIYDHTLDNLQSRIKPKADGSNAAEYNAELARAFSIFPDDLEELHQQGLAYCEFQLTAKGEAIFVENGGVFNPESINKYVASGYVDLIPVTYEDFLPISAAGIFLSNAVGGEDDEVLDKSDKASFEAALGRNVISEFDLYQKRVDESSERLIASIIPKPEGPSSEVV